MADKPAILRESTFTVQEGFLYRAFRTASIWMNKLFFSSVVLLAVWVLLAFVTGDRVCTTVPDVEGNETDATKEQCSTFLTPTSKYLGSMAILTFILSLVFGGLGLIVGKRILEATPAMEEVGAQSMAAPEPGTADGTTDPSEGRDGPR